MLFLLFTLLLFFLFLFLFFCCSFVDLSVFPVFAGGALSSFLG